MGVTSRGYRTADNVELPDVVVSLNRALGDINLDVDGVNARTLTATTKATEATATAVYAKDTADGIAATANQASSDAADALALAEASVAPAVDAVATFIETPTAVSAALTKRYAKLGQAVRPGTFARASNPPRTMLATFQPGHGFTQSTTSSFNYNDTTDYVLGGQSAHIVTNGAGGQAILTKSAAVTLNMTGKVFAILVKVTNSTHLSRITLLAGSSGFANNFQIQAQASLTNPHQEITPEARWSWVTLPWNPSTSAGTPDRAAITDLRIAAVDDNTGNLVKVQIQAIATQAERPAAFPNGVASIGFDDNFISQSSVAKRIMDQKGFSATCYSIVDLVGQAGRQTLDDLRRAEEYSGWEVAGHAWTVASHNAGFNTLSPEVLEDELALTKGWLLDNNFKGRDLFAYPLGNFNASVVDATARYYSFGRTVNNRQQETLPPGAAYTCRAQSSTNTVPASTVTAAIDKAIAQGTWINLLYHDIVASPGAAGASVQVTEATFQTAMDYLQTSGIPVRTTSQILRASSL